MTKPKKSTQTVTADGHSVQPLIEGVKIHQPITQQDQRGTVCEIYSPFWKFDDIPMVFAYLVTIRPGQAKGWAVHHHHVDRYFFSQGSTQLVLYDSREDSPTHGMINEFVFSEFNRSLVSVPTHVYHAVMNIGSTDSLMFNLPSEPYHHEDPDKFTLPLNNDIIPYRFPEGISGYQR